MVDRYTLINSSFISSSFEIDIDNIKPNYNANPTQKLPIITFDKNKKVSYVYWGSTKEMTKNNPPAVRLINVELSKLKKSNMLLNTFKFDRCLIPCDGFYFWKKINKLEKTPYYFKYIKNKLIYCAGIREKYEDFSGNNYYYFSFLTSNSSSDWKPFTSKLPLEFDMRYFDIWFDKKSSINKILPFLSALKIHDYKNFIVSPYFQNVKLNNDSLIQPRKSINQYGNYSLFD